MNFRLLSPRWWGLLLLLLSLMTRNLASGGGFDKRNNFNDTDDKAALGGKTAPHQDQPSVKTTKMSTFNEIIKDHFLRRRKRQDDPVTDPLIAACKNVSPRNSNPLRCYHCVSNTKKDKEPMCDHKLWKYLKHSEKARLRETCDHEGTFCVKIVQQKLGERITTRGCFGDSIAGPNRTKIASRSGCMIFNKKGYRTTLCLCDSDFCNDAPTTFNITCFSLCLVFTIVLRWFG